MRRECERAWAALGTEDRLRKKERNTIRQAESGDVDGGLPDANQLGRLFDTGIERIFFGGSSFVVKFIKLPPVEVMNQTQQANTVFLRWNHVT